MTQAGQLFADGDRPPKGSWAIRLAGRRVIVTEVFWSYWNLAAERQAVFFRRAHNRPAPWTSDPVIARPRFTNAYRASDRVSQYLLHNVIYDEPRTAADTIFRTLLFKIFNRADSWEHLVAAVGEPTAASFDARRYACVLDELIDNDRRVYSAAYIMPNPQLGFARKHHNHLALIHELLRDGTIGQIEAPRD
ncbi:MAG: putative DNA base hypermodification protein [Acidimicrobiales bacterium]